MSNPYGLYDMLGNASELCNDLFSDDYYGSSPDYNPVGPDVRDKANWADVEGAYYGAVERGIGGWWDPDDEDTQDALRCGNRNNQSRARGELNCGFRVVLPVKQGE